MNRYKKLLPACVALALSSTPAFGEDVDPMAEAPAGPFGLTGTLDDRFLALTDSEVAYEEARPVEDLLVTDPFVRWHIAEGTLAPIRLVTGEIIGGWFVGTCTLSYTPPAGQETDSMKRVSRRSSLDEVGCTEVYFLSDDAEVLGALGLDAAFEGEAVKLPVSAWVRRIRRSRRLFDDKERHHAGFAFSAIGRAVGALRTGAGYGYFDLVAKIDQQGRPSWLKELRGLSRFSYSRDPAGGYTPDETVNTSGGHPGDELVGSWWGTLTSHPWEGAPETNYTLPNVDVVSAKLDLDISVGGVNPWAEMEATAEVTFTTRDTAVDTVVFKLLHSASFKRTFEIREPLGFEVLEVTDYSGEPLEFMHRYNSLMVRLRSSLPPGRGEILTVRYKGNAMPRVGPDSFGLLANYAWWPQPGGGDRLTWSVRICTPKVFLVAGTGTTIKTWTEDGKRCEQWEETVPVTFPAINMGRWRTGELEGPHGIKIRGFFLAEDVAQLEPALQELKRALEFYEHLFGPYPYAELDVAQSFSNMGFWQAPAGLIELSRSEGKARQTFEKDLLKDFFPKVSTAILVHELGHQWWGHKVGWRSYRDQWVSETFAEYASFLYMSNHYGEESYLGRLEYWEQAARKSDEYGPAVLGFRLGRGRVGQMYHRGPFILHMLRRLVGDKPFSEFTRTLATAASNRNASTQDVVDIALKVLGPDVEWFFDQWLFRTGLPDLEVEWREVDGKVEVTLSQTQPEEPFRLQVPIAVDGKGKRSKEYVMVLDGRTTTAVFPIPGGKFRRIRIDPYREILTGEKTVRKAAEESSD
jgi:hypothetical protein